MTMPHSRGPIHGTILGRSPVGPRAARVGQADRGHAGRGTGRDHPGGLLVAEAVVGHEADAERAALQELRVAPEPVAQRGEIRHDRRPQPERLQLAQVVRLDANPEVVLQVRILPARAGRHGLAAGRAGHRRGGGRQREVQVRLGGRRLEGQDEEGQELEGHVEHRRDRELDLLLRLQAARSSAFPAHRPSSLSTTRAKWANPRSAPRRASGGWPRTRRPGRRGG